MYRSIEDSLQQLEHSSNLGENLLDSQDISNIWQTVRSYQAELAIQDQEIEFLNEKCDIYAKMVELEQRTCRNIKG